MTTSSGLATLLAELRQFVTERDWEQFHDPKNLAMLLASEVGELVAEYRWVPSDAADEHSREPAARARIAAEIGDVGIALMLLCQRIGLDPIEAMAAKLATNRLRYPVETSRGRAEKARP
jgi:NTP pyrophosphatase (non-canonical NTP hydrolase)